MWSKRRDQYLSGKQKMKPLVTLYKKKDIQLHVLKLKLSTNYLLFTNIPMEKNHHYIIYHLNSMACVFL